jgi:hypothetical protein
MTDRARPLGNVQKAVISAMRRHGGTWSEGAGWIWDTVSNTRSIMEALARRGIVHVEDEKITGKFNSWTRRTYMLVERPALGERSEGK